MNDFEKVLEDKFGEALELYGNGHSTILFQKAALSMNYETIALDSVEGPDSRCTISRQSLDSRGFHLIDRKIISFGTEVHRQRGDTRRFEDLEDDAISGGAFFVCERDGDLFIEGNINPAWQTVGGLAIALSRMRVVPNFPIHY